jgi:hypothetical protein
LTISEISAISNGLFGRFAVEAFGSAVDRKGYEKLGFGAGASSPAAGTVAVRVRLALVGKSRSIVGK